MTAYTRTKNGPPTSGRYSVNDVVTDGAGTKWRCVIGGLAGPSSAMGASKAAFAADASGLKQQAAPTAKTTSTTLTVAELLTGFITGNQGAAGAAAYTLPLATSLDAALPSMAVDDGFDFSVLNLSTVAAEDITITTNTGHTVVGNMVVESNEATAQKGPAAVFRVRKTAASTYVCYRVG